MSTKQLKAKMITTKAKITYNNSRMSTIYSNILSMNFEANKSMILQTSYKCYLRYYNNLIQGNISQDTKRNLSHMLSTILASLTPEEYNQAFQISPPPPVVRNDVGMVDSGYTFYVVNRVTSARTYFIIKNFLKTLYFKLNTYYTFDLSDPSNLNTKFSFSEENDSGTPYKGVTYVSTPGNPGAKMILYVYKNITAVKLYTFNDMRMFTPVKYIWGYTLPNVLVYRNQNVDPLLSVNAYFDARQNSYLSIYESAGPKYGISDYIEPMVFFGENNYQYNLTYGTYYLEIPKVFPTTLLNKGYEDVIFFKGDEDKKVIENVKGLQLAPGNLQEGDYAFYYGIVQINVYKPFPFNMSVYSKSYGFMGGAGLFRFTDATFEKPTSQVMNLSRVKLNILQMTTVLRFQADTTPTLKRKYGFTIGVYDLLIPNNCPVAFLNKGKEDVFVITPLPDSVNIGSFLTNDGNSYVFYTGYIRIYIKGYFEAISISTQSGYSGGYKLFVYNAYNGPQLPFIQKTHPTNNTKGLCAQTTMSILNDRIHFNEDYVSTKYGLYNGVYMIFNIPRSCPITLLNNGKTAQVLLESAQKNSTIQGTGPDGLVYTFYYGILKITVNGNFGFMTLYTLYNNYMGGFKMFSYDSSYDMSSSYPDPRSIPVITPAPSNTSFTEPVSEDITYLSLNIFNTDTTIPYDTLYTYTLIYNSIVILDTETYINGLFMSSLKFTLRKGLYIFQCLDRYMTLLNHGKEQSIVLKGILSQTRTASDGKEYSFYKGDLIALYVYDNFITVSLEILDGPVSPYLFIYEGDIS